ncbi:MAG TPA: hypothetical protein VJL09_00655, partial [Candidatus Paceibacterota bacterium]
MVSAAVVALKLIVNFFKLGRPHFLPDPVQTLAQGIQGFLAAFSVLFHFKKNPAVLIVNGAIFNGKVHA